jgi:hypothetical protein
MTKYYVMTKPKKTEIIETIRTSKKAAEDDVRILKDICRKHAWIVEDV